MATFRKRSGPAGRIVWQAQIIRIGERPKYGTFDTKSAAMEWARSVEAVMDRSEWVDRTEGRPHAPAGSAGALRTGNPAGQGGPQPRWQSGIGSGRFKSGALPGSR